MREIKVAILVIACGFLVFFGLNFLKGKNIFSPDNHYVGMFENICGLKEQAPVYVRGYKVGQVDKITYDYSKQCAFTVTISMHKDILLTDPTEMRLFDDGVLGGKAIEVMVPVEANRKGHVYAEGDTIPAYVVPGLLETFQDGFMAKLDNALENIDSLIVKVNAQIDEESLKQTLINVEHASEMLSASAHDINEVTQGKLPVIIDNADTMIVDAKNIVRSIKNTDISSTFAQIDNVLDTIQTILTDKNGTVSLLLNDTGLYCHIDSTIVSVDNLVTDLKNNPKRYVHFSLFGQKEKSKKQSAK